MINSSTLSNFMETELILGFFGLISVVGMGFILKIGSERGDRK
tara:strand:- start:643 stop:771 length:129 start_codon:yes stop_codon:yes gene_type:complete